ncbi:hypothetical protein [Pontibacter chitinilyticus]|uniref:hypothetical protein n=1 Tax=Pontibacter chitinilyticus TaxID=2674989 RepID=UPI00321A2DFB
MRLKTFFLNGTSVFLGLIFFTAGMAKLYFGHKFPGLIGPVWLEERLAQYGLGLFARFIAYSQIAVGFILLTLRYRTIGAIALLPMLLNILMVTVSQQWPGTPYVLSFFLLLNLMLLTAEAPKLLHLLGFSTTYTPPVPTASPVKFGLLWLAGLILVLISIPVSFYSMATAYVVVVVGLAVGLFSYAKGGRAGSMATMPGKGKAAALVAN